MGSRLLIVTTLFFTLVSEIWAEENLTGKVVRLPLNQNEPAVIKVGLKGITTLEFPNRIEAIDGYGFSLNPVPDGPDLFQISFNKGTNYLSLKAMREGVKGNLTVVLEGKAYSLFCEEFNNPTFIMIFEAGVGKRPVDPKELLASSKEATPARLLGFLDKIKGFPSLKISAPEIFKSMDVAEPDSDSSLESLKVTLHRVIRDNALDSVGFEVELANKGTTDFLYDPESFAARVGEEAYPQSVSDASGMVPAGKAQTAFFVVTGTASGGRNDLSVTNKFSVIMRQIKGEMDPHRKVSAEWKEPPNEMPAPEVAATQESPLPQDELEKTKNGLKASRVKHLKKASTDKPKTEVALPDRDPVQDRSTVH